MHSSEAENTLLKKEERDAWKSTIYHSKQNSAKYHSSEDISLSIINIHVYLNFVAYEAEFTKERWTEFSDRYRQTLL